MAKPMKTLELHYPMIQFLIMVIITHRLIFARFYWLLYVTWCKSLDSYYTISPLASIFVLRLLPSKRSKASVLTWHFYYFMYMEKYTNSFCSLVISTLTIKCWSQMLFRKGQKKVNKIRTNDCKLNSTEFSRFDLRDVVRVYSHDSLSRFWSNHSGNKVN